VWFDLVVPVDVFGDVSELASAPFLFEDSVESFQFSVGLGVVDAT
jgi:hypothetical protein